MGSQVTELLKLPPVQILKSSIRYWMISDVLEKSKVPWEIQWAIVFCLCNVGKNSSIFSFLIWNFVHYFLKGQIKLILANMHASNFIAKFLCMSYIRYIEHAKSDNMTAVEIQSLRTTPIKFHILIIIRKDFS